jgi:4-alpha-glucanotransferase
MVSQALAVASDNSPQTSRYSPEFTQLAAELGLELRWEDACGVWKDTPLEDAAAVCEAFGFPAATPEQAIASLQRYYARWAENRVDPNIIRNDTELSHQKATTTMLLAPDDAWLGAKLQARLLNQNGEPVEDMQITVKLGANPTEVRAGDRSWQRYRLVLSFSQTPPHGEYWLELSKEGDAADTRRAFFASTPDKCYPGPETHSRAWGGQALLQSLTSAEPSYWGSGDWTCADTVVDGVAELGGGVLILTPNHAPVVDWRVRSPYTVSSRTALNPYTARILAGPDAKDNPELAEWMATDEFETMRAVARGDYHLLPRPPEVLAYDAAQEAGQSIPMPEFDPKSDWWRAVRAAYCWDPSACRALADTAHPMLYRQFVERELSQGTPRAEQFRRFCEESRALGDLYPLYCAIQDTLRTESHSNWGEWYKWPEKYRDCGSAEVRQFEAEHQDLVRYYEYLQFIAREAQDRTVQGALEKNVLVTRDLAVGTGLATAEQWQFRRFYAQTLRFGAPAEPGAENGQDWDDVPPNPVELYFGHYATDRAVWDANMKGGGQFRMDHFFGIKRLYMFPRRGTNADAIHGVYVNFREHDRLKLLALRTEQHQCALKPEDLGTAPRGFHFLLQRYGLGGMDIFGLWPDPPEDRRLPHSITMPDTLDWGSFAAKWEGYLTELDQVQGVPVKDPAKAKRESAEFRERVVRVLRMAGLELPAGCDTTDHGVLATWKAVEFLAVNRPNAQLILQLPFRPGELLPNQRPGVDGDWRLDRPSGKLSPYAWLWGFRTGVDRLTADPNLKLFAALAKQSGRSLRPAQV